jgi:hypothetical protein
MEPILNALKVMNEEDRITHAIIESLEAMEKSLKEMPPFDDENCKKIRDALYKVELQLA